MLTFNDMLATVGIDPKKVIIFRHRPREPELFKVFPWLASERPELLNAYQQTQSSTKVESTLKRQVGSGYLASFFGHEACRAVFIGLFSIDSSKSLNQIEFHKLPEYVELNKYSGKFWFTDEVAASRPTVEWFNLNEKEFYSNWKGKLVVEWPPPERSWWRRAHKNRVIIHAIHEESIFNTHMPDWKDINLTWDELKILPLTWQRSLSQWRGIYYIFDTSDCKGYVGSASGGSNILGRWENYGETGHGGNKLLRGRDPRNFEFSIIERVSPDMETSEIVRLELSWKERLHSMAPFGLNSN